MMKNKKPATDIYLLILSLLGVNKDECIIIEDYLIGVKAVDSARIDVVTLYEE